MTRTVRRRVLILGSGPSAVHCRNWPAGRFDAIVAINNAWALREDWTHLIHPDDFPADRLPPAMAPGQVRVTSEAYVPEQNRYGGVLYAGGTMAFTAGYWALGALRPGLLAFFGCDMVYPATGRTHFYGAGTPDPLRADISLRSLEAKSARLSLIAAEAGCHAVNLSRERDSRLLLPRAALADVTDMAGMAGMADMADVTFRPPRPATDALRAAKAREAQLGYHVAHGRYWEEAHQFNPDEIDTLDALWLTAWDAASDRAPQPAPVARSC